MLADAEMRRIADGCLRVLHHDETILQVVECGLRNLADVVPMTRVENVESGGVEGLKRPIELTPPLARVQARVGGRGYGMLRQADATERIAKTISCYEHRWTEDRNLDIRRGRRLDVVPHPPDHVVTGRIHGEGERESPSGGFRQAVKKIFFGL